MLVESNENGFLPERDNTGKEETSTSHVRRDLCGCCRVAEYRLFGFFQAVYNLLYKKFLSFVMEH